MAKHNAITFEGTGVPIERIASQIYLLRGEKVMLDSDLASLYMVTTAALNQQVKRNLKRFPTDFAFQLSIEETGALMSQIVISKSGRGGRRKAAWAFTEQGVAMLSSVLRGDRAAEVNVAIMRTFVRFRQVLSSDQALARKIAEHDEQIAVLIDAVERYLSPPEPEKKRRIGYL